MANIRREVAGWRAEGYAGASPTSRALLQWWFEAEHALEAADRTRSTFRYYFAQREAVESVIWLHDVKKVRDKFDLLRFDASGAVSATPDFIVRDTASSVWIVETKGREELDLPQKMARLKQWCTDASAASAAEGGPGYGFVYVDQQGFELHKPQSFAALVFQQTA